MCTLQRYIILAAEPMRQNEKENKKMAQSCFEHIGLEADKWRVGHTKARALFSRFIFVTTCQNVQTLH